MSCLDAKADKFLTVAPTDMVEKALTAMEKANTEYAAVVEDGRLVGMFSLQILVRNLLPVSVTVGGGVPMDIKIPAAPGIAKRLNKIHVLTVAQLMDTKISAVIPDLPLWEAINTLAQNGSPLLVVDPKDGKFLGGITLESALGELSRLKDQD